MEQELAYEYARCVRGQPADPRALADAINKLLRDRRLAKKMGKAGRLRVEKYFSWVSIARKTKDMYTQVIKERS